MWRVLFTLAGVAFLLARPAAGQISPGPLSNPHAFLDSNTQCTSCHRVSGAAILRCLDCHSEIAGRIAARRGLHSTYGIKSGSSQECARCHSEHNGREFPLIKWDRKAFDHRQTGYLLQGKHASLSCEQCHAPQHIAAAERQSIKLKDLSRSFLGLSTTCTTCHQDQHNGRLGQDCLQCHNYETWQGVARQFDHAKTRYPLTGLHVQVACEKCHTPGQDGKPRYAGLAFDKCSDCHSDPHRGSFAPQGCQSCHSTGGWKHVSSTALSQGFDHSKTKYPLLGKHQEVECIQCHRNGDFKQPLVFQKCMDCHRDEHQGQFIKRADGGECASCHSVDGFKPAKFGVKEHAGTAYPLQGGHAKLTCDRCHVPRGKETLYKIKFDHCLDCHKDDHQTQFAGAPYQNRCEQCHTLDGYRPATFDIARHQKTAFALTGGHLAVACVECHAPASSSGAIKTAARYHFNALSCTSCHDDPHRGQFRERMERALNGHAAGCEACHSTKVWNELTRFDHEQTSFPLTGAHRAVACIDCHKPPDLETKLVHADFRSTPRQCEDCHANIHGPQFAKAGGVTPCGECHGTARWKPSLFDHDRSTHFALQGLHRNVRCADCHKLTKLVEGKTILFYKPTPTDCKACHGADVPLPKKGS